MHAEFFNKGFPERYDFVHPIATINLDFCDDPLITVLDFVQVDPESSQKAFKKLGSLALTPEPPPA